MHSRFISTSDENWDFSELAQHLIERERSTGLSFFMQTEENEVTGVFVELAGGMEEWAIGGKGNILLYDPTYGTNRSGMKLCCFVAP